jgi:serine phosphatase RsbU (regulator of sigma subunit)
MFRLNLTLFLILFSFFFSAQESIIDKYFVFPEISKENLTQSEIKLITNTKKAFNQTKNDTIKVNLVVDLILTSVDQRVWPVFNQFLLTYVELKLQQKLSKKEYLFFKRTYGDCLSNVGYLYGEKGKLNLQKKFTFKAIEVFKETNHKLGLANSYNNLGFVYDKQGNTSLSLDYYMKSLKIKEELKDLNGIATTLINLGFNHFKIANYELALSQFYKSLKISKQLNDQHAIANAYNQIAACYQKMSALKENEDKKQKYTLKAFNLYHKALKTFLLTEDKFGLAETYNNLGSYYLIHNNKAEALNLFEKSYKIQTEIEDKEGLAISYNNISKIHFLNKNYDSALDFAIKGYELSKKIGFPMEINEAAKLLYEIYKLRNKKSEALYFYEVHVLMRDSIENESNTRKNIQLSIQYEYTKQKTQDSIRESERRKLKDAVIQVQKVKLSQQRNQNFTLIGGLLLVVIFLIVLFNRFKASQNQNRIINEQKIEVDKQKSIVTEQHKEITDSIKYAERIQGAILPPDQKWQQILPNSFVLNKPKDILSGDFYWIAETEKHIFVAAADCTGHGVPGALISIVNFNLLNKAVLERGFELPSDILDAVNQWLTESLNQTIEESSIKDGMDISLVSINKSNGKVLYSGANNPLYLFSQNEMYEFKADKQPVGSFVNENISHFTTKEIPVKFGDTIYLFSDGFADQFGGPNGKKYKYKQLKERLFETKDLPLGKQKEFLNQEFNSWKGNYEQTDDVLVIGIKF